MLVLSRRAHDSVVIGDDIEIRILSISGDAVKLGIEAPANIAVHRAEVFYKIEREKYIAESSLISQVPE